MKTYLLILPIAALVAFSQIIVKWRTPALGGVTGDGLAGQLTRFMLDPVILGAYASALLASFAWLYVVTKLPLTVAFPVYIGVTFAMVLLGGWAFLGESLSPAKMAAVALIMCGIVLGMSADA